MRLQDRLNLGRQIERDRRAETEVGKLGNLRAGMSGILSDNGDTAGACHRKAHLRSLGIEIEQPDSHKLIMFELGFASEDITYKILQDSLAEGEILLREEEIPIEWQTANSTKVTGRPDIVICDSNKKPKLGLELKSVHSLWTAKDVVFASKPKLSNIIQAAHYMHRLQVPYKLVYKSYSALGQAMSDWAARVCKIPAKGEPNSQYVDYNDKGGVKGIRQFEIIYDLDIDKRGRVRYKLEDSTTWNNTVVTVQDIERFFEFTSKIADTGNLGKRPMALDIRGDKASYSDCQYCPLQSVCDKYETAGYQVWLEQVRKVAIK